MKAKVKVYIQDLFLSKMEILEWAEYRKLNAKIVASEGLIIKSLCVELSGDFDTLKKATKELQNRFG